MNASRMIGALLAAAWLFAACAKKEEPAAAPEAAAPAATEPAAAEAAAPADANKVDAEHTSGDKVVEPPPPAETG